MRKGIHPEVAHETLAEGDLRAGYGVEMVVALRQADPAGSQAVGLDADVVLVMVNGLGGQRFKEVQCPLVDGICAFKTGILRGMRQARTQNRSPQQAVPDRAWAATSRPPPRGIG